MFIVQFWGHEIFCGWSMTETEQFKNSTEMENYMPLNLPPLQGVQHNFVYLLLLICVFQGWGSIGKYSDTGPADRSREYPNCSFHKTFSHFLCNISALLQLGFVGFLAGPFQKLYSRSCSEKQGKHPEVLSLKRRVNFIERSCRATHHSQPVTELRISHEFSPVLSDISQPIQVIT